MTPLIVFGVLLLVACSFVVWRFAQLPLQPAHPAVARVVAIVPVTPRLYADRDQVFMRNGSGTGYFSLRAAEDRCRVGEWVKVEQRGTALKPLATTCRE
jgi:hypothetical protein